MADQAMNNRHNSADGTTGHPQIVEEIHQPDPGHADQGNPLLALDPGMVIWTWLIFFVFLFVLHKYAWKPILDSLDERETSIRKASDDAEAARLSLEAATEEQRKLISAGRQTAAAAISEARSAASEVSEVILKDAKGESEKLIIDAQSQIEEEKQAAVDELRSKIGDLSVLVAAKFLDKNLDDDRNRELVKEYVTALEVP
jgi:F-type H+-transporting ATPase subunit b